MLKFSLLLFFYAIAFLSFGQHPYYRILDDHEGLPSNEVYKILQDKKGYLWIGCDAGLFRYNGFHFKAYKHPKQNSRSISYLHLDDEKNLWCANFSGQIFVINQDSMKLVADFSSLAGKYHFCFYHKSYFWKIDKNNIELRDIKGETKKNILFL